MWRWKQEVRVMGRRDQQPTNTVGLQRLEKARKQVLSWKLQVDFSPGNTLILDFWPPGSENNNFVWHATKFVLTCDSSCRKLLLHLSLYMFCDLTVRDEWALRFQLSQRNSAVFCEAATLREPQACMSLTEPVQSLEGRSWCTAWRSFYGWKLLWYLPPSCVYFSRFSPFLPAQQQGLQSMFYVFCAAFQLF